jgi:hypothetical protein
VHVYSQREVVQISPMTLDERQEQLYIAVVHLTGRESFLVD